MSMSGTLRIDLGTLARNYRALNDLTKSSCETACVVKANAYGLGAEKCAAALYKAGASSFFVATIEEAVKLRKVLPEQTHVYTLNGLSPYKEDIALYKEHNVIPVLGSFTEMAQAREVGELQVALHIDTGMNRLGLRWNDVERLYTEKHLLEGLDLRLVISHFTASEDPYNPENATQIVRFREMTERMRPLYPRTRFSLCNSGGLFLGQDSHFDMVRAGLALYGGHPSDSLAENPMEQCFSLNAPVLQIKPVYKGESVGYNATHIFAKDTYLAVISLGYADGFMRGLSNRGVLYWKGFPMPIRGLISMDLLVCDLENIPYEKRPKRGDMVELIGTHQTIDDLAKAAETIPYEILTSLNNRYKRVYTLS